jgi:drug/metabolite transporter (DMT)-like permease
MLAVALALGSSVCWGVSDFLGGLQARRIPLLRLMLYSQGFGLVCLAVVILAAGLAPPSLTDLLPAVGAGAAGALALAAFYRALAIGQMSIVAPVSSIGVAVPVLVGLLAGNRPAALQLVGVVAAVFGVVMASRSPATAVAHAARGSVGLALIAALGFGSYFVGMRYSARFDIVWALAAARLAATILVGGWFLWRRPPALPRLGTRVTLTALAAVGALDLSANALYAVATRHGELSIVAVAASLYPVATVLLARAVLRERVSPGQELGIFAAVAGVVLIAVG